MGSFWLLSFLDGCDWKFVTSSIPKIVKEPRIVFYKGNVGAMNVVGNCP
jgi:hypothetical protein